jgi:drug/metabolite transporter (DMT)-like permease
MSTLDASLDPGAALRRHRIGLLLVTGAAVAWSTAGFFSRLIALDSWTILFWRGLFGAALVACFMLTQRRSRPFEWRVVLGGPSLLVILCSVIAMTAFIPALHLASVAEVSIIYATSPFLAAGIAWLWLRERASRSTMLAGSCALLGIAVAVGGAPLGLHLWGDLLAFTMTSMLALMMVVFRRYPRVEMVPAACISALISSLICLPFAHPGSVGTLDLFYLACFGMAQMGLGALLFTIGSPAVAPAENALIGSLDAPLAPFWVWLAFAEVPSPSVLLGGLIVLGAVGTHLVVANRAYFGFRRR